jgi:hypothetical protein
MTALHKFILLVALFPFAAVADTLACIPDTMCIDEDCQAGHDDKATILVRDWQGPKSVIHTREEDVRVVRKDKPDVMFWSGRNAEQLAETLAVGKSDMRFAYVIRLDATSTVATLTARGACVVQK